MNIKSILISILLLIIPVIICSAETGYNIYWGDMHGHTGNSDGKGSFDDYFTYSRDAAKLDFVVVSDHDFGNSAPWRMPQETWDLTQQKVDQYTVNEKFIAIAGYEWTSQPKYWTPEEALFSGPIKYYNHKNVYFPDKVDYLFSAKDIAYNSPDRLARMIQKHGGLIHNNHPSKDIDRCDQFDYNPAYYSVITNTEILPDTICYDGKMYTVNMETLLRNFLNKRGKTGFIGSTDTHEGKPEVRTAILSKELTRPAIFEALGHRRNYAVMGARIALDFQVNGHPMGEEILIEGKPRLHINVKGTDIIKELLIVRDGKPLYSCNPGKRDKRLDYVDDSFKGDSYYYIRVTQVDKDKHGNCSQAWSSPIWVKSN
ncbi:MAG: CehA/McbA family metallohydrolase [Armatimonadota bacterium]